MSTQEIKQEIQKLLLEIPEENLAEVLSYLRQVKETSPEEIEFAKNFRKILTEDKKLLKKLAK
jgi:predicted transcriptional regulator